MFNPLPKALRLLALVPLLLPGLPQAATPTAPQDFLEPDQAFVLQVALGDARRYEKDLLLNHDDTSKQAAYRGSTLADGSEVAASPYATEG